MNCCEPHWTAWISALLVPIVAILGIVIAHRQWRTAQSKLKLDVWEKRFTVYECVRTYLRAITSKDAPNEEESRAFLFGTSETRWLFGEEIADFFYKELYQKGMLLALIREEISSSRGEERLAKIQQAQDLRDWFIRQVTELDKRLFRFMSLEELV